MRKIESIVIVRIKQGYLAHLRFKDSELDEDICADTRWGIMSAIDRAMAIKDRGNYMGLVL